MTSGNLSEEPAVSAVLAYGDVLLVAYGSGPVAVDEIDLVGVEIAA